MYVTRNIARELEYSNMIVELIIGHKTEANSKPEIVVSTTGSLLSALLRSHEDDVLSSDECSPIECPGGRVILCLLRRLDVHGRFLWHGLRHITLTLAGIKIICPPYTVPNG